MTDNLLFFDFISNSRYLSSVALSLVNKGGRYPILHVEISVRIVGVYGIGCNTFYPHIHQLLLEISL